MRHADISTTMNVYGGLQDADCSMLHTSFWLESETGGPRLTQIALYGS